MHLTEEQKTIGRRNFLKIAAGAPALVALGAAAMTRGPMSGGPVKIAIVGTGGIAQTLLAQYQKEYCDLKAVCDINPRRRAQMVDVMVKKGWPKPKEYDDWREMLQQEDIEAVHVATPLWTHGEISVASLNAGKHVLCEKMMAKSAGECQQMIDAAKRNQRVLEIGYQRAYNPLYQAAYSNIIKPGVLGDVYHARLVWHRNASWRKNEDPPAANYDPRKWGYPDWEHLLNWRMYRKYSEGLLCELGSHQLAATNWFFDSFPEAVYTSGGTFQYKDGREVYDHVYAVFNYSRGRTATFSSIQSNAFEDAYEMFMGTKGTLILSHEIEAYLFNENESPATTAESKAGTVTETQNRVDRNVSFKNEIAEFCAAIRTGSPLRCGGEKAMKAAVAVITGNLAAQKQTRLEIK